jgi:hypothetical protein
MCIYHTNKKAGYLGLNPKRLSAAAPPAPAVFAAVPPISVPPGATVDTEFYDLPQQWIDLGWFQPATPAEQAAAEALAARIEEGTKADAIPIPPTPVPPGGEVPPPGTESPSRERPPGYVSGQPRPDGERPPHVSGQPIAPKPDHELPPEGSSSSKRR